MSEPNPVGRPTVYRPEYCERIQELASLGCTDEQIATFFGVSPRTVANWKEKYPEFLQAINLIKLKADATVADSLYAQAGLGNVTAQIFWLKNRRPQEWRDKQDLNLRTPDGLQIMPIDPGKLAGISEEELRKTQDKIREAIEAAQRLQIEGK
jgi:transcriptional regulator with XRE-family HTH domain